MALSAQITFGPSMSRDVQVLVCLVGIAQNKTLLRPQIPEILGSELPPNRPGIPKNATGNPHSIRRSFSSSPEVTEVPTQTPPHPHLLLRVLCFRMGRSFLLKVRSLLLTVTLVWSLLLKAEIRFGLLCLWWKISEVFFTYGSPRLEIGFGLFCLRFPPPGNQVWSFLLTVPPVRKSGLVFSACGSPIVSKKDEP